MQGMWLMLSALGLCKGLHGKSKRPHSLRAFPAAPLQAKVEPSLCERHELWMNLNVHHFLLLDCWGRCRYNARLWSKHLKLPYCPHCCGHSLRASHDATRTL